MIFCMIAFCSIASYSKSDLIHHHRPQGPTSTLFRRVRWDFTCVKCNICTATGSPVLSPIQED